MVPRTEPPMLCPRETAAVKEMAKMRMHFFMRVGVARLEHLLRTDALDFRTGCPDDDTKIGRSWSVPASEPRPDRVGFLISYADSPCSPGTHSLVRNDFRRHVELKFSARIRPGSIA